MKKKNEILDLIIDIETPRIFMLFIKLTKFCNAIKTFKETLITKNNNTINETFMSNLLKNIVDYYLITNYGNIKTSNNFNTIELKFENIDISLNETIQLEENKQTIFVGAKTSGNNIYDKKMKSYRDDITNKNTIATHKRKINMFYETNKTNDNAFTKFIKKNKISNNSDDLPP